MECRDVDLLDLVVHDHDEAGDGSVDGGYGRVTHALRRADTERILGPRLDELCGTSPRWPSCQPRYQMSATAFASSGVALRSVTVGPFETTERSYVGNAIVQTGWKVVPRVHRRGRDRT